MSDTWNTTNVQSPAFYLYLFDPVSLSPLPVANWIEMTLPSRRKYQETVLTTTVQDMRRDKTNGDVLKENPAPLTRISMSLLEEPVFLSILRPLRFPSTSNLIITTLHNLVTSSISLHPLNQTQSADEKNIQKAPSPPQPPQYNVDTRPSTDSSQRLHTAHNPQSCNAPFPTAGY